MCTKNYNHMRYGSWGTERERQYFLSFWATFCPFTTLRTCKVKIFKKMKKATGYVIILHMCTINEDHMIYGSWDKWHDRVFCHFGPFLPFDPPNNPKNQNFEKMKNMPGDFIILHLCTTNDNHMINGSWDTGHDRQNFLSFWAIFLMPHEQPEKTKFWKNEKKKQQQQQLETPSFYTCVPQMTYHTMYVSWDMECDIHNFFWFWTILPFYSSTPLTAQKIKILKKWKKHLEILLFYTCVP